MGILTKGGAKPVMDEWVTQLQELNNHLKRAFSDNCLGDKPQRRQLLERHVGEIRRLTRLTGEALEDVLRGRVLVGVDGTINTFGGQFPYYVDFLRALAKPSQGESVVLKEVHCPMIAEPGNGGQAVQQSENEVRQCKLAALEVQAALSAIDRYHPSVVLMDGPLVRFDMRTKASFSILREKAIKENILLVGCIENIESRVLCAVLGEMAPSGWQDRFDRDLLWGVLEYGEILEVARPGKGALQPTEPDAPAAAPIRTWFMRSAWDPGVVGLDLLEEQVEAGSRLADYLFTLSPADGRGIPIWLDLVDREVRLTQAELEAYAQLLDPQVKRIFDSKREQRFF